MVFAPPRRRTSIPRQLQRIDHAATVRRIAEAAERARKAQEPRDGARKPARDSRGRFVKASA